MTASDYILDLALIGIVLLQIKGRRLGPRALIMPVVIVVYVAFEYLKAIPTGGNDLLLIGVCAGVGLALGIGAAFTTRVWPAAGGAVMAQAGVVAAVLWILGCGFRFAFQEYATHGGENWISSFSAHHAITSGNAWVDAIVLMALCEALSRTLILAGRAYRLNPGWLAAGRPATVLGAGEQVG